jgi:hypothetical protein
MLGDIGPCYSRLCHVRSGWALLEQVRPVHVILGNIIRY